MQMSLSVGAANLATSIWTSLWVVMKAAPASHSLVLTSQNYCHLEETNDSEPAHQVTISSSARQAVGIITWQLLAKQPLYKMSWWTWATPKKGTYCRKVLSDSLNQHKNIHKQNSIQNTVMHAPEVLFPYPRTKALKMLIASSLL